MNVLFQLAWEFFKTGLFAVGGGLATVPFLSEMAAKYGWFTQETLSTMIAVSESTPGPMGVNMATYVGYSVAGIPGSIVATLSLACPSVIVICIVARMLETFKNSLLVQKVFYGIRPAVVGLILSACLPLYLASLLDIPLFQQTGNILDLFPLIHIVLFAGIFAVYKKFKLHPILVIVIGGIIGVLLNL